MEESQLAVFLDTLQEEILSEAKNSYGARGYDRWLHPRFQGPLENADSRAELTGACGDTITIWIRVDPAKLIIVDATYTTTGCASSSICASFAAEVAIGSSVDRILDMNGQTILDVIGKFPSQEEHCAHLAISTLQEAVDSYMRQRFGHKRGPESHRRVSTPSPLQPKGSTTMET